METSITLPDRLLCDLKCILDGSFYPLTTFMDLPDYNSVITDMRLSSGTVWPIPIVLPMTSKGPLQTVNLLDKYGNKVAIMEDVKLWETSLMLEIQVYDSSATSIESNHPYVQVLRQYNVGTITEPRMECITGKLTDCGISNSPFFLNFADLRLSPADTTTTFRNNNWNKVIGFQTRNPMHYCHIELTKFCMTKSGVNNLLIQPIVGVTQECDVAYSARIRCYRHILQDNIYAEYNVMVSILPLSMRMAGPREAVWHAIIRKNYGCTQIGRAHV